MLLCEKKRLAPSGGRKCSPIRKHGGIEIIFPKQSVRTFPSTTNFSDTRNKDLLDYSVINKQSFLERLQKEKIVLPSFARQTCSPCIPKKDISNQLYHKIKNREGDIKNFIEK